MDTTNLCRYFCNDKPCPFGDKCKFDHQKTPKICRYEESDEPCPYGKLCRFEHRASSPEKSCRDGAKCTNFHREHTRQFTHPKREDETMKEIIQMVSGPAEWGLQ